jgi:hypothetical protein
MSVYVYTKTPVSLDRLIQEINQSSIIVALDLSETSVLGDQLTISFKSELSVGEVSTLDTLVANHSGEPLPVVPDLVDLDIPKDEENVPYFKQMIAQGNKKFKATCMTFTTGKYKSLFSKDSEGNDLDLCDLVFMDASRNVLTKGENESDPDFQTRLDQNCKFTWLYFTPNTDYGISKGRFMYRGIPSGEFHNWLEFAPHIPKAYGGSVPCLEGAFPLDMLNQGDFYQMDGCACLIIEKEETYYSHRIGHKIEHELGDSLKICSIFDIYV